MNRVLYEQIVPAAIFGGTVGVALGGLAAHGASEAIERDTVLMAQVTSHPEVPIVFDDGVARSGEEAMNTLQQSADAHGDLLTVGEASLALGLGALAFASAYVAVQHLRNLGVRGYAQRSLGK